MNITKIIIVKYFDCLYFLTTKKIFFKFKYYEP